MKQNRQEHNETNFGSTFKRLHEQDRPAPSFDETLAHTPRPRPRVIRPRVALAFSLAVVCLLGLVSWLVWQTSFQDANVTRITFLPRSAAPPSLVETSEQLLLETPTLSPPEGVLLTRHEGTESSSVPPLPYWIEDNFLESTPGYRLPKGR
jgi:hypothetical protein